MLICYHPHLCTGLVICSSYWCGDRDSLVHHFICNLTIWNDVTECYHGRYFLMRATLGPVNAVIIEVARLCLRLSAPAMVLVCSNLLRPTYVSTILSPSCWPIRFWVAWKAFFKPYTLGFCHFFRCLITMAFWQQVAFMKKEGDATFSNEQAVLAL